MALLNSLFSGVSGLQNLQSMMDVIGNNIANVDTIGFKSSRVTFSDTFNELVKSGTNPTDSTGGTNSFQVGLGMKINSIDRNWNQGTFQTTGISTDLALQGPGMFILNSNGQNFYSRAGAFEFDSNGKLVDPQNGAVVQGKVANGLGQIPQGTTIQDIVVDKNLKLPAIKTSNIAWGGNLQSSSATIATNTVNLDDSLAGSTPYTAPPSPTSTQIVGKDGTAYTLNVSYTNTAGAWTPSYQVYDSTGKTLLSPQPTVTPAITALTFNSSGNCTSAPVQITSTDPQQNINFSLDFSKVTLAASSTTSTSIPSIVNQGGVEAPVIGSVSVYDSLGNAHTLSVQFDHSYGNTWSWKVSVPATDGGTFTGATSGSMTFDPNGQIQSITQGGVTVPGIPPIPQITYTPGNGAETEPINLNFGSGTAGITQTSLSSQVAALSQDGSPSATLTNLNIDQYGNVVGVFSNGNSRTLAQVMVATFTNPNGLVSAGSNMYSVAANSGTPRIDTPGENSATTIQSGALEQSNVDLSQEFTNMIVSQRGFEANAKVVTTSDTLLQDITNLVR
ncbi:MAG TPA: flagellar hook protein FlgE [Ignavibacteriaceae bacterium]|nr:flagellar hook protein FlgE [Ignavibacteriaceae bacterium]